MKLTHLLLFLTLFCGLSTLQTQSPAMTDQANIPLADPIDGIAFMAPPQANTMGTANLDFPIKLPAGRLDMAPELSISYNHGNQNSWLGKGWDLFLPAITVETRWGVPRYDTEDETETYLLNGEQLAPVAHRGAVRPRSAELSFHPRIEGDFAKITRHGDHPLNYWWEINYTDGATSYFGGTPETGQSSTATLGATAGKNFWGLTRMVDRLGNRIDYHYVVQNDSGRPGTQNGQAIYPDYITYTGFGTEEGPYRIDFIRDRELNESRRPDVEIDLTLGFKNVKADLLRKIEITFRNETIRSYDLQYAIGVFNKTLLSEIIEYDRAGAEFYRQRFDYYDEVTQADGSLELYGPEETWSAGNDDMRGFLPISNLPAGFSDRISSLGGATSTNIQGGLAITFGFVGSPATKDLTVGGSVGSGSGESVGVLALVDINGDNLPDKILRRSNGMFWRANQGDGTFGALRSVIGLREFSVTKTSEFSFGFEANLTPLFAGYENTTERTTTSTYFSDFNGDDLVDVNYRGTIYFNHLNAEGDPTFTTSSADTPSPIISGAAPDPNLVMVNPEEQEALIDQTPLHDVVRVWEAPYSGNITIDAPVQLIEFTDPVAQSYSRADGVVFSIQQGGTVLHREEVEADDFSVHVPTNVSNLTVTAGQRIYFRLQSVFDGAYDRVQWDPIVYYENEDLDLLDADGKPVYRFQASEDFLLVSNQSTTMQLEGTMEIVSQFSKPITTDSVGVVVFKYNLAQIPFEFAVVESHTFAPDTMIENFAIDTSGIPVDSGEVFFFQIVTKTNVDWTAIEWNPILRYTALDNGDPVQDADGNYLQSYCPGVFASVYAKALQPASVWESPDSNRYTLRISLPENNGGEEAHGSFTVSVKGPDTLYIREEYSVATDQPASTMDLEFVAAQNDTCYFGVSINSNAIANWLETEIELSLLDADGNVLENFIDASIDRRSTTNEQTFGNGYRGWGQFIYNGNRERADAPIIEFLLFVPEPDVSEEEIEDIEIDPDNLDDPDAFADIEDLSSNPSEDIFVVMFADAKAGVWRGYDNLTLLGPDFQSSSRLGEDDIILAPPLGGGGSAPGIISESKIHAVAGGVSAGPGSLGVSHAWNDTKNVLDVMDMNGDRYPDLVSSTSIQYTGVYGGLSGQALTHGFLSHESHSEATGVTAGGKYVDSGPSNAAHSSGKGSKKRFRRAKATTKNSSAKAQSANESAENSGSLGGNLAFDNDHTLHSWFDINGDGLTDKVWRGGDVALNYGYRFGPRENWGFSEVRSGESVDYGFSAGINISNNSIAAGYGFTRTDNQSLEAMQDVNGDGLTDLLSYNKNNSQLSVRLNTGSGFTPALVWTNLEKGVDSGDATAQAANTAVTVCINIFLVRICFNPSGALGWGVSRVLSQFNDIDGDGFPDIITGETDREVKVRRSKFGRTNLLRSVVGPLGGEMVLDYELAEPDYDLGTPKWVLREVDINDGFNLDGPTWQRTTMSYAAPKYDRHEREFYGFGLVREEDLDTENGNIPYRAFVSEYRNDNYYEKGLLAKTYWETPDGNRYRETENIFEIRSTITNEVLPPVLLTSDQGRAFPVLVEERENYYEGAETPAFVQSHTYRYDSLGILQETTSTGNGLASDLVKTVYTYHDFPNQYLRTLVATKEVFGGGELLRRTEFLSTENGLIYQERKFLEGDTYAETDYDYDEYGNLTNIIHPPNVNGEQMTFAFTYDTILHTYRERMEDAYGYESKRCYEPFFGQTTSNTDIYGQETTYDIDDKGRVEMIKYPRDPEYSLRFSYFIEASNVYSSSARYNPATGGEKFYYRFVDGLGREIQTKETAVIDGTEKLKVSGLRIYDAFDRMVEEYHPTSQADNGAGTVFTTTSPVRPAITTYDILDRPISFETPAQHTSILAYSLDTDVEGLLGFRKTLTDPRGEVTEEYSDVNGQLQSHRTVTEEGDVWITSTFDGLGQLLRYTNTASCVSLKKYDLLGRLTEETPCDAGTTNYTYDLTGNLIQKITPNLRELNPEEPLSIEYQYEHNRLLQIDYPKNYQNRVEFYYGEKDAAHNRGGRIWLRQDASGGEEYFYDEDGNTIKSIRTILINEASVRTYVTEAEYDSWGRMTKLHYPDGETVTYDYLADGNLNAMRGEKDGNAYPYLDGIKYDEFGVITEQNLGNGSRQEIDYHPDTRRVKRIQVRGRNENLLDLNYVYDEAGNLLQLDQNTGPNAAGLGAASRQTFAYDTREQLIEANGQWTQADGEESYAYVAEYDANYNPTLRSLNRQKNGNEISEGAGDFNYRYQAENPHRIEQMSGRTFTYDANGNQLGYRGENGSYRYQNYRWDEEDRLTGISQNGKISQFTYDGLGRRIIRSKGQSAGVFTAGAPSGIINHGSDYVIDVNPFFSATKTGFTKHYFAHEQRIASKEGTGEFNNYYWYGRGLTAGDQNYTARIQELANTVWNYYGELNVPPGPPTLPGYYAQPEQTGDPLPRPAAGTSFNAPPPGWPGPLGPPDPEGPPGPPTWFPAQTERDSIGAGYGYEGYGIFPEVYQSFYHYDALGNIHGLTDRNGELEQFNAYLPTGALAFSQQKEDVFREYAFNGQRVGEKGEFYHFGARYYDAVTGLWLSQDPSMDDYPGFNPYAFGLNNPYRYSDPNGKDPWQSFPTEKAAAIDFAKIYNKKSIRNNWEYGAKIYRITINGKANFFYENAVTDRESSAVALPANLRLARVVADIHTHSRMEAGQDGYNDFSPADRIGNYKMRRRGYLANPRGELKRYDPMDGTTKTVRTGLPYDRNFYTEGDPNKVEARERRRALARLKAANGNNRKQNRNLKLDGNVDTAVLVAQQQQEAKAGPSQRRPRRGRRSGRRSHRRTRN